MTTIAQSVGFAGSRPPGALAVVALALVASLSFPQSARAQTPAVAASVAVEVNARPLEAFDLRDRTRRRFGQLEFRSGLVLTSSFKPFGGLSAFRVDPKGEGFIAMNDKGDWFTGRLVYKGKALAGPLRADARQRRQADHLGAALRQRVARHRWRDALCRH
jgi:hypothetical protein